MYAGGSNAAAHQGHGHAMSMKGGKAKSMRSTLMTKRKSTYVGGGSTMSLKRLSMSRRGTSFGGSMIGGSQGGGSFKSNSRRSTNRGTGLFKRKGSVLDGGSTLGDVEEEDEGDIQQEEWVKNAR
jgi:hypothetical protein